MNAREFGLKSGLELFEGNYCAAMSRLHLAGYTPWSTEDIMDARNAVTAEHPRWNNYIDTDFGIVGTKEKIYLAPHSARLRVVTPQTVLTNGGLALEANVIETMRAYDRKDHILNLELTEEEARNSQVWLDFAAGNQKRLDKYVENTFRFGKDKFNYDAMMGVFVPAEEEPIERAVVLGGLCDGCRAGGGRLGDGARFVGVRRGAKRQKRPQGATRRKEVLTEPQ
ncbi:hypothetical protein HY494_03070 [Candidatus Woesearchaeota archaeon]|nr:hypothetical protein [Candidatus Woesearchaeota archaeon]